MRAVQIEQADGPAQLRLVRRNLDPLSPGQARVRVEFAGINFWDIMQRRGTVPVAPHRIPGSEGSGRVIAVAEDVTSIAVGDRVAWSKVQGSYAEEVQAGAEWFVAVPDGVSMESAAAVLGQGTTAWYLAAEALPLASGASAVVLAAAGGVGHILTQLLTARGVRVVGVVSTREKREFLGSLGVSEVLLESAALVDDVRRVLPAGADGVFDANGGQDALRDLAMLAIRGHVVYYGTANGPLPALDLGSLAAGSLAVSRVRGQDFLGRPEQWRATAEHVLSLLARKDLHVHIDRIAPLDDATSQHERMEARENMGKLLLAISDV